MIVYPAVDLRAGRCVRLRQGDLQQETVFAADPVKAALRWAGEGAEWLHIVNLDGAVGESGEANIAALRRIRAAVDLPVQFGGGLRSVDDVARVLELGVSRVVLGTVAVRQPAVVSEALGRYGDEAVAVGIDAREGRVAVHGWQDVSDVEAGELGLRMKALGVTRVIYTDVSRDGMLSGLNVAGTAALARHTGMRVIASGGVGGIEDLAQLEAHASAGIEGVIIGMALYQGHVRLPEAIALLRGAGSRRWDA